MDLGCYGHHTIRTPRIDQLASTGLRFDQAYRTASSCSPSRSSFITGRCQKGWTAGTFRGRKRASYEGGVRTPGIAYWPGTVPAGKIDDTSILSSTDWFPTVCSLMGVEFPLDGTDYIGEDITSILKGAPRERKETLFWEANNDYRGLESSSPPKLAVRKGNWKLLMELDESRLELFDIPNDPSESRNLAKSNPGIVSELKLELLRWKNSHASSAPKSKYKGAESSKGIYYYENKKGTYRQVAEK